MPASNASMIYAIGGVGMTTMAPNALLMKAALNEREKLSNNQVSACEFKQNLENGNFSKIPHCKWNHNPFNGFDYARWVDYVNEPRNVSSMLFN